MKLTKKISALILSGGLLLSLAACNSKVDDITIQNNVQNTLTTTIPAVNAEVKDGVVTLSGSVASEGEREQAEKAVTELKADKKSGIKDVVNNITVAVAQVSPDAALEQGVSTFVKDFPDVKATVNNGVITVTGSVEKARVQTLKQGLDALNPQKTDMSGLQVK